MKKFGLVILSLVVVFCGATFSGCAKENLSSSYSMELEYNSDEKTLYGTENICYFNTSKNTLEYLKFNLYPNAFRENSKLKVISSAYNEKAYYNGQSYGKIEILSVKSAKSDLLYEICGKDENILKVTLKESIYPDESVEICITFKVTLAEINHRLGVGKNTINFGGFYPIACVYEDGKGFLEQEYNSSGDPFYSDVANYNVKITCDKNLTLASYGMLKSRAISNDNATYKI